MNANFIRLPASSASFGWMRFVQWIFVLLLAFDLVGSPFHQHHHEGGADGYSTHADEHDGVVDLTGIDHELSTDADDDNQGHGGHSLSAIRGATVELNSSGSSTEPQLLGTLFVLVGVLTQPVAEGLLQWRPDRSRPPIPLFRTVPPDGRAPPVLSA